jgi:hypothetical protein
VLQTYKILSGKKRVEPSCWFTMASDSERVTRQSADPLNIRPGAPRLDIRRYFYSHRVVDSWNSVPHDIKNSVSVLLLKMPTEGTETLCLHPPKDFLDRRTVRAEATLANNISREDPPGPTINHQVTQVSNLQKN